MAGARSGTATQKMISNIKAVCGETWLGLEIKDPDAIAKAKTLDTKAMISSQAKSGVKAICCKTSSVDLALNGSMIKKA